MSWGEMTVTFLLLVGIVPGMRNWRQVMLEIQPTRSPSSVSGFMFSFTIRLLAGNFLQLLNSRSPGTSVTMVVGAGAGGGAGGGEDAAGGRAAAPGVMLGAPPIGRPAP